MFSVSMSDHVVE